MSPLSSPLSAIVADSLRRGVDLSSPTGKRRPGLSALRKSRSQRLAGGDGEEQSSEDYPSAETPQRPGISMSGGNMDSPKGRAFSVSLGEFFRLNKGGRSNSATDQDAQRALRREEEDAPS